MADLSLSPEEAYVAELLAAPALTRQVPALDPADFTEPHAQAIYQAILRASADTSTSQLYDQPQFIREIAALTQDAGTSQAQLTQLAEASSSDPWSSGMASSYARMIAEAAIHRELIQHGHRLARDPTRRDLGDRLIHAAEHARTVTEAARDLPSQPSAEHASQELAVLAGLLTSPGEAHEVTRWLPPEAFAEGIRRDIYHAITAHATAGDTPTPGSIMHALAEQRDPGGDYLSKYEAISWYFQHNITPVQAPPGTAILTGRDLLASHTVTELGHSGRSPETAAAGPQPAHQPMRPERAPQRAPDQAVQPPLHPAPAPQPEPGPEPQP